MAPPRERVRGVACVERLAGGNAIRSCTTGGNACPAARLARGTLRVGCACSRARRGLSGACEECSPHTQHYLRCSKLAFAPRARDDLLLQAPSMPRSPRYRASERAETPPGARPPLRAGEYRRARQTNLEQVSSTAPGGWDALPPKVRFRSRPLHWREMDSNPRSPVQAPEHRRVQTEMFSTRVRLSGMLAFGRIQRFATMTGRTPRSVIPGQGTLYSLSRPGRIAPVEPAMLSRFLWNGKRNTAGTAPRPFDALLEGG